MTTLITPVQDATDDDLIIQWAVSNEARRAHQEAMSRVEIELTRRMQERGATAILNPLFEVKLEVSFSLDAEVLRPLAELIPPDEWQRGYTEAHEETIQVAARADLRVVKGWTKYGAQIAGLIEKARVPGVPRLRIAPKKG